MKRPIKPFVVEVKKATKPKDSSKLQLNHKEIKPLTHQLAEQRLFPTPAPVSIKPEKPTGRILQSLEAEPPAPVIEEAPRRRGRPPGSRNKAEAEAGPPPAPKKRGRPRKIPEGTVRQVPVTPDLASALLARISDTPSPSPLPSPAPSPASVSFRELGQLIASAVAGEVLERVRAGERWKRRLRGAARSAFERRHAKA